MRALDLAEHLLPIHDFEERHRLGGIQAPAGDLLDAIAGFDDGADRWVDFLIRLREAPGRMIGLVSVARGIAPGRPRFGLADFTPLGRTDHEMAFGLVGRFWRIDYGLLPCADAQQFRRTAGPGLCRLLLAFRATAAAGGTQLETVTRVACNDRRARLLFSPYWLAIRPASGWIRRRVLEQVKRAAQARQATGAPTAHFDPQEE